MDARPASLWKRARWRVPCSRDCLAHNQRTLQTTDDNTSTVDRYAYILVFGMAATPRNRKGAISVAGNNEGGKAPSEESLVSGGAIMLLWHKIRHGHFRNVRDLGV